MESVTNEDEVERVEGSAHMQRRLTTLQQSRSHTTGRLRPSSRNGAGAVRPAWRRTTARRLLEGAGWGLSRLAFDGLALLLVVLLVTQLGPDEGQPLSIWSFPAFGLTLLAARGLYRDDARMTRLDAAARIAGALSLAAMFVIAVGATLEPEARPTQMAGPAWLASIIAVIAGHLAFEWLRQRARLLGVAGKATLIVGAGEVGGRLEHRLLEHPELGLRPMGFVATAPDDTSRAMVGPILGVPADLRDVVERTGAEHVIFAFLPMPDSDLLPLVRECEALGVGISVVPRLFETTRSRVELSHIGGLPLFAFRRVDPKGWQFALKHFFDRIAAGGLLLLVAPLFAVIATAVKLSSPGPILFRQQRVGRDGSEFDILKFRTMRIPPGSSVNAVRELEEDFAPGGVEGQDRRTRVGAFLRRTSLDELPQLLNVLRGDMSIVGPRPERPEFVRLFTDNVSRYGERHRVKSGITGWAQVHGLRGQTSLSDRVEWDNHYIENWSLWLDAKIMLMTVVAAARGE